MTVVWQCPQCGIRFCAPETAPWFCGCVPGGTVMVPASEIADCDGYRLRIVPEELL